MATLRDCDPRELRFAEEYVIDLNASQAAIRAGYSVRTANVIGPELLSKPRIALAVATMKEERAERVRITADRTLVEIARLSFATLTDIMNDDGSILPLKDWPQAVKAAVTSVKVRTDDTGSTITEVRLADKTKALTLLAKHLGLVSDRRDTTTDISELLKAVLLAIQDHRQPRPVMPDAEWAPLPPAPRAHGHHHALPAPPGVEEADP